MTPVPTQAVSEQLPFKGNAEEMIGFTSFENTDGAKQDWLLSDRMRLARTTIQLSTGAIFNGVMAPDLEDPKVVVLNLIPEGVARTFAVKDIKLISCLPR